MTKNQKNENASNDERALDPKIEETKDSYPSPSIGEALKESMDKGGEVTREGETKAGELRETGYDAKARSFKLRKERD